MPPSMRSILFTAASFPIAPLSMHDGRYHHYCYLGRILPVTPKEEGERGLSESFCFFISAIVVVKRDSVPLHSC